MGAFEQRFRIAMARAGYRSVRELAKEIGMGSARLGEIRKGLLPPQERREAIAQALRVSPTDLWGEDHGAAA